MKGDRNRPMRGMVTSRKCPQCGHSEIGYTTPEGEFHALKPGTLIEVSETPATYTPSADSMPYLNDFLTAEEGDQGGDEPWVPEPLRYNKRLRQKYGVMVKESRLQAPMTGDVYCSAFLRKLEKLIEREIDTPLPVILDRFFSAPHLASGNPSQISQAMLRELDEIQRPVRLVSEWLEEQDEESLATMIHPVSLGGLTEEPAGEEEMKKELESLSLEEFLEML